MEHTGWGRPERITESKLLSSQFKTTRKFILAKKPTLYLHLRLTICFCEQTSVYLQTKIPRGQPHVVRHDEQRKLITNVYTWQSLPKKVFNPLYPSENLQQKNDRHPQHPEKPFHYKTNESVNLVNPVKNDKAENYLQYTANIRMSSQIHPHVF